MKKFKLFSKLRLQTFFSYNPGTKQGRKWENAMTLDKESWGFRRNAKLSEYLTIKVSQSIFGRSLTIACKYAIQL
jgi:hypothetical protein